MNKPILNTKSVSITRGPLPGSKKLLLNGVPFREVALSGGEAPVRLYDTSGPYTDDSVDINIEKGLRSVRRDWILARGDVEEYEGRARKPEDDGLKRGELLSVPQFDRSALKPLARQAGPQCQPASLCAPGPDHRGNEIYRGPRKSGPQRARRRQQLRRQHPDGDHAGIRAQTRWRAAAPSFPPTSIIPKPSR